MTPTGVGRLSAGPGVARIIGAALATLLAAGAAAAQAPPEAEAAEPGWRYEFGRGLSLGEGQLRLGGYLASEATRPRGGQSQARLSHASLFVWWQPHAALQFFGEFDQENVIVRRRGAVPGAGGAGGGSGGGGLGAPPRHGLALAAAAPPPTPAEDAERRFSLERLQLSWTLDDALVLRGGKFLSPVGRWNLVHADPLVWTTSRPLLTQSVYPHNVTGLMASGLLPLGEGGLDYALYASNGREWQPDARQDPFSTVRGGRLVWKPAAGGALPGQWELGLSAARYEQQGSRGEPRRLLGLDLHFGLQGYELSAEWLQTRNRRPPPRGLPGGLRDDRPGMRTQVPGVPTEGHYLQGVAPLRWLGPGLGGQLWVVGRVEWIRDSLAEGTLRQRTLGLAWRPLPALSFKLEHRWVRWRGEAAPEGWAASASVLF